MVTTLQNDPWSLAAPPSERRRRSPCHDAPCILKDGTVCLEVSTCHPAGANLMPEVLKICCNSLAISVDLLLFEFGFLALFDQRLSLQLRYLAAECTLDLARIARMLQQKGADAELSHWSVLEHMPLRRLHRCVDIIFDCLTISVVHRYAVRTK